MLYKDACVEQIENLPKVDAVFEKISMVFVGLPMASSISTDNKDVYVSSVLAGDEENESVQAFTLSRTDASSWLDFYSKYLGKLDRWMKFVGLGKSHYRIIVVDTRKPISVLALAAIPSSWKNTIVIAVTGDQTSTLIEQNTSYAAVGTALKRGLPIVAISTSFVDELIFYTEKEGLVVRAQALVPILYRLISSIDAVMDTMGNDSRLGVKEHCFSAILSASEKVYPSVESALYAQESSFSIIAKKSDITTACLLAFAPADVLTRIDKIFAKYRRDELKDAIGADHQGYPSDGGSSSGIYDLLMIYGIKDGLASQALKSGYDSVASKVPELSLARVA